ncbi:NADH:ubiquinone reductase (Na(+)-transporting) subunit A [Prevotella sp. HMSC073D09]|uniref:Na(+)-translocating NADH-quinone reductase subunit A n=1 Tax=Prevotella sp. HMSC073D09 TaxID=1739459 RepID=UPI0008A62940|nr:Na(+)-translocating NADH-quinone reductase subunit A [Prevotella sp. HMSC073D09]OFQ26394.1 NADH:ubiquinone reductase (Na(+)-transporting) subunit A [Prevotella sp. HMSC073D09]
MANVIKLRKGLNIHLKGTAAQTKRVVGACTEYVVRPDTFEGVVPKLVVHEGDRVEVGDALFVDKNFPEVRFASPVSGTVKAVDRGERRKILGIRLQADEVQKYHDFGRRDVLTLSADEVKSALLEAGLFGYIYQLPYAVSTNPQAMPKAIFVSALRDMPLANNFEYELQGNERDFQTGLTALSKMATTHLGIGKNQKADALVNAKDVEVTVFDGPCPAGNVSVQVNHISPVNKGEVVWTVDPTFVIFFGRLFNTGKVNLLRTIALGGSAMASPMYVDALIGTPFSVILKDALTRQEDLRLINGNPLTGTKSCLEDSVGVRTSEITAIPEGADANEMFGWIMPRTNQFSTSRSYFSWLMGKKEYDLDARVKGGERHIIMSGEYDSVLPMDIYGEFLIKAIIVGDIDKMEQLGIYEVSPEDFALAEFVDSSKLELQRIVRQGLNMLRKENA